MTGDYMRWAGRRIRFLQDQYLHGTLTRKDLAILARSITKPVGADPRAAKWSLDGMPGTRPHGFRRPTPMEKASWNAFALWAIHQKGEHHNRMHVPYLRLEDALDRLRGDGRDTEAIMGRLANARNQDEAVPILARLMRMLRDHAIPTDHAALAHDLRDLDDPRRHDRVVARWTRRHNR